MSRFSQYAKNVGLLVGQSFIQRILGMVTTMVLARVLGAASFGAYSIVSNTASSAYGLVRLGVDAAIHVHTAESSADEAARRKTEEMLAAGLLLLLLAGVAGGLGCLIMADWLAEHVYGKQELAVWIRVAAIAVFLQCISQFCYASMVGLHRFSAYTRVMIVSALLTAITITVGVLFAGLNGAVVAMIGAQFLTVAWLAWALRAELRVESLQLVLHNFFSRAGQLLKFGFPFYAVGMISIPVVYYLQGLVVRYTSLEALGYLRAITALVSIVSFVPSSASAAMVSMLARTRIEDETALADKIMGNVKMVLVFALITATVVTIVLPWLLPAIFGQEYSAATGAASLALLTAVLAAVTSVIGNALFSVKRVDFIFLTTLVQMAVFGVGGILLIPEHGLIGYLTAELVGYLTLVVVTFWCSLRWFRRNAVQVAWLAKVIILFSLLVAYSAKVIIQHGAPSMFDGLIGVAALLIVCIWGYTAILDSAERNAVLRLIGLNA